MPIKYHQKSPRQLSSEQLRLKLERDVSYEKSVNDSSNAFYDKPGVTAQEQTDFDEQQAQLWQDYLSWAIASGLYEEVSVEQQLADKERFLSDMVRQVNELRAELSLKSISLKEAE